MGLTYTHASDLARRRARLAPMAFGEQLLLATSAVIALAMVLGYAGRTRSEAWEAAGRAAPVLLTDATKAADLEPALATAFSSPQERRAAADAIAGYLSHEPALPNVGTLARIRVQDQPLLTAAQLATLKPSLAVRTPAQFRSAVLGSAVLLIASFHLVSLLWRLRGIRGDYVLLAAAHLLVGLGFVMMLARPDPLRDTLLVVRYTEGVVLGVAFFGAASLINLNRAAFRELTYLPLAGALVVSVILLIFGSGPGTSGAKVNLGPVQPIEAIRLLLALFLAGYFARRWELLRQVRAETVRSRRVPAWLNIPRPHHVLPVAAGVAAALVLFFFQKDLGPALLLSLMFLGLFAIARGGAGLAGAGLAGLIAGFGLGYVVEISSTLVGRLEMWQSPWDNAVRGGDQVAQALWALATGAATGTGLGLGSTRFVPEGHTDLVLATLGEELGFAGLLVIFVAFAILAIRGFEIARRASSDYRFFLATALTLAIFIPVLVMAAGTLGLLPLTGVVTPFLSYGGSAMVANFSALGLLAAIDRDRDWRAQADLAAFGAPLRWTTRVAAAAAILMMVVLADVQVLRADSYLVRPQLSVQADGGRRFQYNPRVLDALRAIPRGTIYDRRGLPVATNDRLVLAKHAEAFKRLGIMLDDVCPNQNERCYPAGRSMFHVLGDANTRENWSATNTSYVERDSEDRLRGFDDRATLVTTTTRSGAAVPAIRRDYATVIPLVRHRFEPEHADVKAMLAQSRDVTLTIDARLQIAVAAILARTLRSTDAGKGAVVILDAASGQILASVSYPLQRARPDNLPAAPLERDSALDRARYGLYPPGSTFKIVTAAAALREDPSWRSREFVCQRLSTGRIGARIPGHGPIHDDDRDRQAHGRLSMHDATVRSCNAYFAQLATALGSDALARTAALGGITLNTSQSPDRIAATLPHAGFGQGEVLTSPLRMARVVAAIGSDGVIREAPVVRQEPTQASIETPFVSPAAAKLLASYLRDAVTNGTGRLLRNHPGRIAGKTGTAELDEAASHAWFAGFAPYGQATRRIAFAVLLEHAGYGGGLAADVAGQIVRAAGTLELAK